MSFFDQFHEESAIDKILSQPIVSLEELLRADELIQECFSGNQRLLKFLSNPKTVQLLAGHVVAPPDEALPLEEQFVLASAASRVLSCGVADIMSVLLNSEEAFAALFSVFAQQNKNSLSVSLFGRVFGAVLSTEMNPVSN